MPLQQYISKNKLGLALTLKNRNQLNPRSELIKLVMPLGIGNDSRLSYRSNYLIRFSLPMN